MKKFTSSAVAVALTVASVIPASAAGAAMPTIWSASKAENAQLEQVRHHRRYYRHHHRRHYHRHYRNDYGAAAAAGIIGFGLGAAIAAGANEPRYYDGPYGDPDWHAYCASKYRSYDPRTGTFLGYDGYRHPCR